MSIEVNRPLRLVPIERKHPKRPANTRRNTRHRRWVLRPLRLEGPERLRDWLRAVLQQVRESPQGYGPSSRLASPSDLGEKVAP